MAGDLLYWPRKRMDILQEIQIPDQPRQISITCGDCRALPHHHPIERTNDLRARAVEPGIVTCSTAVDLCNVVVNEALGVWSRVSAVAKPRALAFHLATIRAFSDNCPCTNCSEKCRWSPTARAGARTWAAT
jgi:hypothetical protein